MRVFFTFTTKRLEDYIKELEAIRKVLLDLGCVLTRDWLGEAVEFVEGGRKFAGKDATDYAKANQAIREAEALVVEGSFSTFSTLYQVVIALEEKIPVLYLIKGCPKGASENLIYELSPSPLLEIKQYNTDSLTATVRNFVRKYAGKKKSSRRFNLFIDRNTERYLDWASFTHKKTKAEIIRELVRREMSAEGNEYLKYLEDRDRVSGE